MNQFTSQQSFIEKRRGILLTIWLIVISIASFIGALNFILNKSVPLNHPNIPFWAFSFMGLASSAYVIFAIFIFFWKKWAIFAFFINALIVMTINIVVNSSKEFGQSPFIGLIATVILILLCLPKWKMFE